jgi:hypothetical protein
MLAVLVDQLGCSWEVQLILSAGLPVLELMLGVIARSRRSKPRTGCRRDHVNPTPSFSADHRTEEPVGVLWE